MDEGKKIKINFESDKEENTKHKKGRKSSGPEKSGEVKEVPESSASEVSEEKVEKKAKPDDIKELLSKKEEELREEHDRLLRALAEHENYKKRMTREKADLLKFGNESLIKELLSVLDHLDLSLEHARTAQNIEALIEGIEMIRKEFSRKLEKFGLKEIAAQGEKFDPTKHEATAQVETSEQPEGTVVDELQKGYFIHDRLLRPARVTVAKPPESA